MTVHDEDQPVERLMDGLDGRNADCARVGMNTTATMVIGFGESMEERALHMLRVRDAQDECIAKIIIRRVSWRLFHGHSSRIIQI